MTQKAPLQLTARVGGLYALKTRKDVGAVDAATGLWLPREVVTKEIPQFSNIITNTGLDHIGNNGQYLGWCHVGTGTVAEAATDSALGTFVASKAFTSSSATAQGTAPYYGKGIRDYRFNPGEATGNISEVGISTQNTTGNLFSRALVKDGGGSPTTITVLSDEYLDVTYEYRVYPAYDTADLDTVVSSQDFVLRAALVTGYGTMAQALSSTHIIAAGRFFAGTSTYWGKVYSDDAALGAVTGEPSATSSEQPNYTESVNASYSNGTYYRDITYTVPLTVGNFGASNGIKGIMFYTTMGAYQMVFDTEQAKDNTEEAELVVRLSWARATIP